MIKKISISGLIIVIVFTTFVGVNTIFGTHSTNAAISDMQKGMSIMASSPTDFGSDGMKQSLREIRSTGANYITLVFNYYQSSITSIDIHPGNDTPTDAALISAIDYAHAIGLHVMIKPHVEVGPNIWRAEINPQDRDGWFNAYGAMLNHYADIAQAHGVEEICMGTELIHMTVPKANATNTQHWSNIINGLRARYSGKLTYSATWGANDKSLYDESDTIEFWPQLDYVGLSAYFSLANGQTVPTLNQLTQSWNYWNQVEIAGLTKRYNKPVLFTEVGYRNVPNDHVHPWEYGNMGTVSDETEQANDYTALLSYWSNNPNFAGVQFWGWRSDPNAGGPNDNDFTPQHKQAEAVLTQFYGGAKVLPVTPPPTTPAVFQAAGTVSTNSIINQPVQINVSLTNTSLSLPNALADIEVYNDQNQKVFQKAYPNQNFNINQATHYQVSWTPTVAGNYTVKAGVFTNDWMDTYFWSDAVVPMNIGQGQVIPPPNTDPHQIQIWWPTEAAHVLGLQPFKAVIDNLSISDYTLYWQVDGGALNIMQDNQTDYPHKEGLVDLTNWQWNGAGPYVLNFIAKDAQGNVLAQETARIFNQ